MRCPTKGQVAAAQSELECIRQLAAEAYDSPTACYRRHALAATRHLATLAQAGEAIPDWVLLNCNHLRVCGWGIPRRT